SAIWLEASTSRTSSYSLSVRIGLAMAMEVTASEGSAHTPLCNSSVNDALVVLHQREGGQARLTRDQGVLLGLDALQEVADLLGQGLQGGQIDLLQDPLLPVGAVPGSSAHRVPGDGDPALDVVGHDPGAGAGK